jgi:hypothetical protein
VYHIHQWTSTQFCRPWPVTVWLIAPVRVLYIKSIINLTPEFATLENFTLSINEASAAALVALAVLALLVVTKVRDIGDKCHLDSIIKTVIDF